MIIIMLSFLMSSSLSGVLHLFHILKVGDSYTDYIRFSLDRLPFCAVDFALYKHFCEIDD